jgi:hypothetical protein
MRSRCERQESFTAQSECKSLILDTNVQNIKVIMSTIINVTSKLGKRIASSSIRTVGHFAPLKSNDVAVPLTTCLPTAFPKDGTPLNYPQTRNFSSSSSLPPPPSPPSNKIPKFSRLEDVNPERIRGIVVNPLSLGNSILPGNLVYKKYNWSGNVRKVPVELVHGYFWMIWDLRNTLQKPTLSNDRLISAREAQFFPELTGLTTLADPTTKVDLPSFFTASPSKSAGTNNKVTLVAISFRESGFKLIPSWIIAMEQHFPPNNTTRPVQTYTVSITEHLVLYPFRNLLTRAMKQNTPNPIDHSRTLVFFGTKDLDDFRDVLRMHNMMTNYVFLLDMKGRVRFAGSGEATSDDIEHLVKCTKELLEEDKRRRTRR